MTLFPAPPPTGLAWYGSSPARCSPLTKPMMLNSDYKDMLCALSGERVKFLLVGAYAMAVHGYPRATMDIDFWVLPSPENAEAIMRALKRFGAPVENLTCQDFQTEDLVFQIGVAPRRIDIITTASGLQFDEAYKRSISMDLDGIKLRIPCLEDLIQNKLTTGRTKDLADAEAMELLKEPGSDKTHLDG